MNYEKEIKKMKEDLNKLKQEVEYLMECQKTREESLRKCFTYDDDETSSECEDQKCGCGKPPQQPCPEIEEYLNSISNVD